MYKFVYFYLNGEKTYVVLNLRKIKDIERIK